MKVEAERDLRIFLYDEPLTLLRQQMRKRRDAELSDEDFIENFPAELEEFLRNQYEDQGDVDILDEPEDDEAENFEKIVLTKVNSDSNVKNSGMIPF